MNHEVFAGNVQRYLGYLVLGKVVIVNFKMNRGVNGAPVDLVNALKALVGKGDKAIAGLELNSTNFYNHGNGDLGCASPIGRGDGRVGRPI